MAGRRRRKTRSNEKVEDGDWARMARKMNMKMRRSSGSGPTETTIGRERANDKRENEEEAFKFIISPNRGV